MPWFVPPGGDVVHVLSAKKSRTVELGIWGFRNSGTHGPGPEVLRGSCFVLLVLISMRIQALMSSWPFLGDQLKQNSKFKSEHILHASARYILVSTCLSQSSDPIFSTPGPTEWTCLNPSPSRSSYRYPQVRSSNFTKRAFLFSFHMPVRFFLMLVSFTGSMKWTCWESCCQKSLTFGYDRWIHH